MLYITLVVVLCLGALLVTAYLYFWWTMQPRRPDEPGFRYVYVNNRGRVRDLCAEEREYLSQVFDPFDGARPYILSRYKKVDANEYAHGFIERRLLPPEIEIIQLTPEDDRRTENDAISINQAVFEDRCPRKQ